MEYTEYVIQFTCSYFNQKWNFAPRFLEFYSSRAFGSAGTLTAITRQHVAYLPKAASPIVALGLLNTLVSVTFLFLKKKKKKKKKNI